ncbi:hypothetical protein KIN20_017872 [Parelaphostrongylus tenuis]|uniref:Uncharacterized protein n=1 Tax=Parelaphostrongylus tenuis TaxID=148309 RepID=A0AAD5QNZ3_PARTN|nr:hypothetical protein KIN20_017872 [Parelaphostrongylus tenuis]
MELYWEQIRLLLIREWPVEDNDTEAAPKINEAWRDDTAADRTAKKCLTMFKAGENCLEDLSRMSRS